MAAALSLILLLVAALASSAVEIGGSLSSFDILMPGVEVTHDDQYLAHAVKLPSGRSYIVGFEPKASAEFVHHILLYACKRPNDSLETSGMGRLCKNGEDRIIYGWAKDAEGLSMGKDSGIEVGGDTDIRYIVMQVHYKQPPPGALDSSGIVLKLSSAQEMKRQAGLLTFASYFRLKPGVSELDSVNECTYKGMEPLRGYAARVHTHNLGVKVFLDRIPAGYTFEGENGTHVKDHTYPIRLFERSPQLPQGFAPVERDITLFPGDRLRVTCRFNTVGQRVWVGTGGRHVDEMCNLYLMVTSTEQNLLDCYTNAGEKTEAGRGSKGSWVRATGLAPPSFNLESIDQPGVQRNKASEIEDSVWHSVPKGMGQVGGVAATIDGQKLVIFHRGSRYWGGDSFRGDKYQHITYTSAIKEKAVMVLDLETQKVVDQWGADAFYMPHGCTVDYEGNVWLTDCGLHQVKKFSIDGKELLSLGDAKKPGDGRYQFCKPTHVAVNTDGSFFVADGYCNSRVVHYNAAGDYIAEWGAHGGAFDVPHSIVIDHSRDLVLVADRERARVQAFSSTGVFQAEVQLPRRWLVYAVATFGARVAMLVWPRQDQHTPPMIVSFRFNPVMEDGPDSEVPEHPALNPHSRGAVQLGWPAVPVGMRLTWVAADFRVLEVPHLQSPHDFVVAPGWRRGETTQMNIFTGETQYRETSHLHLTVPGTERARAPNGPSAPSGSHQHTHGGDFSRAHHG